MVDTGKFLFMDLCLLKSVEGMIELETEHRELLMDDLGAAQKDRMSLLMEEHAPTMM